MGRTPRICSRAPFTGPLGARRGLRKASGAGKTQQGRDGAPPEAPQTRSHPGRCPGTRGTPKLRAAAVSRGVSRPGVLAGHARLAPALTSVQPGLSAPARPPLPEAPGARGRRAPPTVPACPARPPAAWSAPRSGSRRLPSRRKLPGH